MRIVRPDILDLYRTYGRCEWCSRPGPREPHHVFCTGMGGGGRLDVHENLLAVDRICHSYIQEHVPRYAQICVIARREGTSPEMIESYNYYLLALPKLSAYKSRKEYELQLAQGELRSGV